MFYVYWLIDPRTNKPFYVGKGKGDRIRSHEQDAKRGVESPKCSRIREIWGEGHQVKREEVQSFYEEKAAFAFEKKLIDEIGIDNLTNILAGASGGSRFEGVPIRLAKAVAGIVYKLCKFERVYWLGADVTEDIYGLVGSYANKYGIEQLQEAIGDFGADLTRMRALEGVI